MLKVNQKLQLKTCQSKTLLIGARGDVKDVSLLERQISLQVDRVGKADDPRNNTKGRNEEH